MLEKRIDTVVLGCTHYPFVIPLIQQIVGANVRVIDPAPSVTKQIRRVLETNRLKNPSDANGDVKIYTSGDPEELKALLPRLLGEEGKVGKVEWINDLNVK